MTDINCNSIVLDILEHQHNTSANLGLLYHRAFPKETIWVVPCSIKVSTSNQDKNEARLTEALVPSLVSGKDNREEEDTSLEPIQEAVDKGLELLGERGRESAVWKELSGFD